MSDAPKSAIDIVMERLRKKDAEAGTEQRPLTDAQRVDKAYLLVLSRPPKAAERDAALTYIANLEKRIGQGDAHDQAWRSFCHVLMSTNEFLYLD